MRKTEMVFISSVVLFLFVSPDLGQITPGKLKAATETKIAEASHLSDVVVSSGDLLEISVYGAPEYRYEVRVSSSGDASLPMIGNIKLAGLSTSNHKARCHALLKRRLLRNYPAIVFVVLLNITAARAKCNPGAPKK